MSAAVRRGLLTLGGGGVTPTTWNPSDKSSRITLSGSNLIATKDSGENWCSVRTIASSSTAKWYWETSIPLPVLSPSFGIGIANAGAGLDAIFVQSGVTAYFGNGSLYSEGALKVSGLPDYLTWSTLRIAVDLGAQKIWFGDEGGWWGTGDPATDANPTYSGFPSDTYYMYINLFKTVHSSTSDFGQAPAYTVPSGFTSVG